MSQFFLCLFFPLQDAFKHPMYKYVYLLDQLLRISLELKRTVKGKRTQIPIKAEVRNWLNSISPHKPLPRFMTVFYGLLPTLTIRTIFYSPESLLYFASFSPIPISLKEPTKLVCNYTDPA